MTDFNIKLTSPNKKIKLKHLLVENEFEKQKTFDSSYLKLKIVLKKMVLKSI